TERPPDVDDLPLDVVQTADERRIAEEIRGGTWEEAGTKGKPAAQVGGDGLRPRPFTLRTIGRLFGARE
ncbi:MAG TPA: hypothetical protein VGK63_05470, partial [Candidatus Limnocylindrales bacterium]